MILRHLILILSTVMLCSACTVNSKTSVIVAGSTSVQPYAEVLAEEYALLYPEKIIDVQGGGSTAGVTAAESGTADIGMSSRPLKESENHLWSVEIAKDGLAIIVHPTNPVADLTLDDIIGVYTGKITNWSEVGGIDAKIHPIAREAGSGTRGAFDELVMGESRVTPKAIIQDSNGSVRQLVAGDPSSIGFISLGLVDNTVKALRMGGVSAMHENIANGSYSLSRPFLFMCNGEPTGLIKQFVDYALSLEGQQILVDEGLILSR